jgi:hypothetical protein
MSIIILELLTAALFVTIAAQPVVAYVIAK